MARRTTLTLTDADETVLESFADPDRAEHAALVAWAAEHGESLSRAEAAVLRLLLRAGAEALREKALEVGYAQLAASRTDQDRAESRARRERYAERTDREMSA